MQNTSQIRIIEVPSGIAIHLPFNLKINEVFRELHGHYDKLGRRWILPANQEVASKIAELFGQNSPNVVACVPERDLDIHSNQLVHGGYLLATWDERKNSIVVPVGVEIAAGSWDVVASNDKRHPCMKGTDRLLKVLVRKDYAATHGLEFEEELGYEQVQNPLHPFTDADLRVELENRGYRVQEPVMSLF